MPISENDRLDLRQALARTLGSERLAEVAMEAMPPLDYDQFATKADLEILGRELRAEIAGLRGDMTGLRGEMTGLQGEMTGLRGEMTEFRGELALGLASNLRMMLAAQLTTMVMLGAWITAVT
jgi:hypothetical protein